MRAVTMQTAQFRADNQEGESLHFENCKGGYFSNIDKYGLKVVGKTFQNGTPTPDAPIDIQCVKKGTKIICGNVITTPCDLYEDDIWYPMSGKVERYSRHIELKGTESWSAYSTFPYHYQIYTRDVLAWNYGGAGECNYYTFFQSMSAPHLEYAFICADADRLRFKNEHTKTVEEWKAWVKSKYDSGQPLCAVYKLSKPMTEQYDPQPIFALMGSVNVIQVPIDLNAELKATMLVRR